MGRATYDDGLYEISSQIILKTEGPEALKGALPSYGEEFKNDVFEMHPEYWDGDCICGWESRAWDFKQANPHAGGCYQTELWGLGIPDIVGDDKRDAALADLCGKYGLDPYYGSMAHCTCDADAVYAAWVAENPHPETCPLVRPNFHHYRSGLKVWWYKYMGRSEESNMELGFREWSTIVFECLDSIKRKG